MQEKLAILDCGGQYTKVIDRRIREAGVYTDIFPMSASAESLKSYQAIILSGGPSSVWESNAPEYDRGIFDLNVPVLGICYGMQLIVDHFGGKVVPKFKTEYGQTEITVDPSCPLFSGLSEKQLVLMSHGDAVSIMPEGFVEVGRTGSVTAAVWSPEKKICGVQFHPEVDPTIKGVDMLVNFVRGICGFKETYALEDRIETSLNMIRKRVGPHGRVLVLVSGGVDSAVTAALLVKALRPEQVFGIHVDHGLMRKNESDVICQNLQSLGLTQLKRVNAEEAFFNTSVTVDGIKLPPLCEVTDPETKRAIIGQMFFEVTEQAASEFGINFETDYLAQGTLRPDLIESGNPDVSSHAHKIKTHHNDVGIIRKLRDAGHVIETNWDWHKDEVRQVARMLGLDESIASRQPFPGPGLGVRILCSKSGIAPDSEKEEKLRNLVHRLDPSSHVELAPIQSVGVQGDNRSYRSLAIISKDSPCDWTKIKELAHLLPNQLDFVNRVAIVLDKQNSNLPLRTVYSHICREEADLLRELDAIVTDELVLQRRPQDPKISQCFAILIPASHNGDFSVVIRAVITTDFMTAESALPDFDFPVQKLSNIVRRIRDAKLPVDMILYDATGKPPATVEWE